MASKKKSKRNIKNHSSLDAGHTDGSKSFYKREKVMPGLLDVYEESHSMSDKLPITQMANNALNELKGLLEQRNAREISLADEEIYAKIKPRVNATIGMSHGSKPFNNIIIWQI
ncbi:Double-strand break repair protein MRE11 [Bienertia sinuspersici]